MQHNPDLTLAHPVTPLRDCSPHIQRMFGYKPKRVTTRDGRLACTCGKAAGCACRAVTRDAQTAAWHHIMVSVSACAGCAVAAAAIADATIRPSRRDSQWRAPLRPYRVFMIGALKLMPEAGRCWGTSQPWAG
jgi:hypothetical protein